MGEHRIKPFKNKTEEGFFTVIIKSPKLKPMNMELRYPTYEKLQTYFLAAGMTIELIDDI